MVRIRALDYAAAAAAVLVVVLSAVVLRSTFWSAPLGPSPEAHISVGPFGSGESLQQPFEPQAAFLSRVRVRLRADVGPGAAPVPTSLAFRLRESGEIVREGRVDAELTAQQRVVTWNFAPLAESAGRRYDAEIVFASTGAPVFASASLLDELPGALVTNGIVGASHIDLTLGTGRTIGPALVLRAAGGVVPGGLPVAALLTSAAIAAAGASRARKDELTLAVAMTLIFTVLVMVGMPPLSQWMG